MKGNGRTALALLVSWLFTLAALVFLPERVPIHWNLAGEVDRWGSKYELLFLPALQLFLAGFMLLWPRLDPARRGPWRVWPAVVAATAWVLTLTQLAILYLVGAALREGPAPPVPGRPAEPALQVLWAAVGLALVLLGNLLPKAPQNWVFGVRTPWTLSSKKSWQVTNRLGGYVLVAFGLLLVLLAVFYPNPWAVLAAIGGLLLAMLYLVWLSYRIWREEARPAGGGK